MEAIIWILVTVFVMCFIFGIACPAVWIFWEKCVKGNPKSIMELYDEF